MIQEPCVYCDKVATLTHLNNGIDRVFNEIGYEPWNCAPCCLPCNRKKSSLSRMQIERIAKVMAFTDTIRPKK